MFWEENGGKKSQVIKANGEKELKRIFRTFQFDVALIFVAFVVNLEFLPPLNHFLYANSRLFLCVSFC